MEMWSKIDPLWASQALKEWRTEHGSHKKSRDPFANQGVINRDIPLAQNRSLPASPQVKYLTVTASLPRTKPGAH
jgi:hypothetical protein